MKHLSDMLPKHSSKTVANHSLDKAHDLTIHKSLKECEKKCNENKKCHSYLFAEGTQHMYTGTCELYDANNPGADGNTGWSCYDKQRIDVFADAALGKAQYDDLDDDFYLF